MEEYCSTVEKLLEATAAMSLAVENKKPNPQPVVSNATGKTAQTGKIATKQPTFSSSSLEDTNHNKPQPPRDRRKSYSQGQNASSLDSKSTNASNHQPPGNDIGPYSKSAQDGNKATASQITIPKSAVDRRYSIASTHIAIANHIATGSQGSKIISISINCIILLDI